MTDGRSQDDVRGPANLMRRRGVKIFSLGIGKRYNMRQLLQMSGNRRKVFTADFKNLGSVVRAIKQKACRGEEENFPLGGFGKDRNMHNEHVLQCYQIHIEQILKRIAFRLPTLSGNEILFE